MQTRATKKIIIDATKLETLLRLGCPEKVITDYIIHDKITKQEDELINTILESLLDRKTFSNWGGNRNPTGKNQHKNKELGQVDLNHLDGQVVDKDKDKDKDKIKKEDKNKEIIKPIFDKFKKIITDYKGREVKTNGWTKQINSMLDEDHIKPEDILSSLDWYAEHIGQPYIPVIFCAESLRKKYSQLEEAIKKNKPKEWVNRFEDWKD